MKKVFLAFACLIGVIGIAFADWDYSIQQEGNQVQVKEYHRIVSLSPAAVEVMFMLGAQEKLTAIATTRSGIWPEDQTSKLESVGSLTSPSIEKILACEPELVLLNSMNADFSKILVQHSINYLFFQTDSIEALLKELPIFGIIVGQPEAAIKLSHEKLEQLSRIKSELIERPLNLKGAFLYSASPLQGFNEQSLPGQILEILGCENIVTSQMAKPILTPEYIIQENPDFLFGAMAISKAEDILDSNPLLSETRAGKEGHIFLVPSYQILRPTPRVVDSIIELYEKLKPLAQ